MLLSLRINNYALIDSLGVDFQQGLNIITGETGAGKSILIGALGLILGKRADLGVLSIKDKKCVVEADFDLAKYKLNNLFLENDLDYEVHTVFRREILPSGKSRAFINDTPVTLNVMQEVALQLVDIHSQHQNLLLNQQDYLLNLIDRFCKNEAHLQDFALQYDAFKTLEKKFQENLNNYKRISSEFEFINHQFQELEGAALRVNELEDLESELLELENSSEIKTNLHEVSALLDREENGVLEQLASVKQRLAKISAVFSKAKGYEQRVESTTIELNDLASEIESLFENLEFDPQRLELAQERLNLINGLLLKYKVSTVNELIKIKDSLKEKVSLANDGDFDIEKQKSELEKKKDALKKGAEKISKRRSGKISLFQTEVLSVLSGLGLPHAQLSVTIKSEPLSRTGGDSMEISFSANKNHPMQEVSKIASGGELSRLMLAIKAVLSSSIGMPTLILDEIDSGVSGDIASKVGAIIQAVSAGVQIINITHLPQVASKGMAHYLVYKEHGGETTRTRLKKLNKEERVQEIAKMLSGETITEAALENAKELLSN